MSEKKSVGGRGKGDRCQKEQARNEEGRGQKFMTTDLEADQKRMGDGLQDDSLVDGVLDGFFFDHCLLQ